jgi:hypothetical protein
VFAIVMHLIRRIAGHLTSDDCHETRSLPRFPVGELPIYLRAR